MPAYARSSFEKEYPGGRTQQQAKWACTDLSRLLVLQHPHPLSAQLQHHNLQGFSARQLLCSSCQAQGVSLLGGRDPNDGARSPVA